MIKMNDIYFKVGSQLTERGFYDKNIEEKKQLVDSCLKDYAIEKIAELGIASVLTSEYKDQVSLEDLVGVLGALIPEDQYFDTLRHLTHFTIMTAGDMQGRSIVWWSEEDKGCKGIPNAIFDEYGSWDSLSTHKDDSYVDTFNFTYDVFMNRFMTKQKVMKKNSDETK